MYPDYRPADELLGAPIDGVAVTRVGDTWTLSSPPLTIADMLVLAGMLGGLPAAFVAFAQCGGTTAFFGWVPVAAGAAALAMFLAYLVVDGLSVPGQVVIRADLGTITLTPQLPGRPARTVAVADVAEVRTSRHLGGGRHSPDRLRVSLRLADGRALPLAESPYPLHGQLLAEGIAAILDRPLR